MISPSQEEAERRTSQELRKAKKALQKSYTIPVRALVFSTLSIVPMIIISLLMSLQAVPRDTG